MTTEEWPERGDIADFEGGGRRPPGKECGWTRKAILAVKSKAMNFPWEPADIDFCPVRAASDC